MMSSNPNPSLINLQPIDVLLGHDLLKAYESPPCAVVVCHLTSMREIGDEFGIPAVDGAMNALLKVIVERLPSGAAMGKLKFTMFAIILSAGADSARSLATAIVAEATSHPVEVVRGGQVVLKVVAGSAATDEAEPMPPARLLFEAGWRALAIAPTREDGVCSGT
jgi:GGDEF domain-containing protein